MIRVELAGLELFGHHGVEEDERERGQRFLFDVDVEVPEPAVSDRMEDAVDYRDLAMCVREVSERRRFHLLEALAAAVADEVLARFPVAGVVVRVRKPDLARVAGIPLDHSAVTVERRP